MDAAAANILADLSLTGLPCPLSDGCTFTLEYPEGYQDPVYDGTEAGFTVIITARRDALLAVLNEHLESHGIDTMKWEWGAA
jgi:hypothetical protein